MMSMWRSSFFTSKRPLLFQDPPSNKTPGGGHLSICRSRVLGVVLGEQRRDE